MDSMDRMDEVDVVDRVNHRPRLRRPMGAAGDWVCLVFPVPTPSISSTPSAQRAGFRAMHAM